MNEYIVPHQGHGPPRNGPSLLQQVRGKYLAVHYDVEGLLSRYVKLLEELNVATEQMKTCKLQSRMLYEGHSAIHLLLKKMYLDFSETRASEIRFAGALELSWNAIQPVHEVISEYASLDEMESWFQHSQIDEQLSEMWGLLDSTFVALRDEVKYDIEPFVALNESLTRVLVVPGQTEVAWRQVHRADQLEQPKLFQNLVKDLDSTTSLLFMKPMYIEEFMEAMQKDMNQYPAKSQTYKMYDERLQQIYDRSQVLPPVNEFDTNDIRRTSADPTNESPPGSVFRGKTTSGDVVSIKMLTAFASTEKAREVSWPFSPYPEPRSNDTIY
ncbi:hypothetical protein DL93DRAFT_2090732 [Clavulina sp. PMI_390]|nr:hypothetical protein DL93DRAFT_2090732 [Clavulina sp. PMI_390]